MRLFDEDWDLIVPRRACRSICRRSNARAARGVNVIGEVELAAPYLFGPVIGITGIERQDHYDFAGRAHILRSSKTPVQVGGNIGTPVIAMTETSRKDQWNVLELSSFQLETIRDVSRRCRRLPERHAESSRPASHV